MLGGREGTWIKWCEGDLTMSLWNRESLRSSSFLSLEQKSTVDPFWRSNRESFQGLISSSTFQPDCALCNESKNTFFKKNKTKRINLKAFFCMVCFNKRSWLLKARKKYFFPLFFCFYNDFYAIQAQRNKDVPWDGSLFRSDALWLFFEKMFCFSFEGGGSSRKNTIRMLTRGQPSDFPRHPLLPCSFFFLALQRHNSL